MVLSELIYLKVVGILFNLFPLHLQLMLRKVKEVMMEVKVKN
jgi:hypothetical protein